MTIELLDERGSVIRTGIMKENKVVWNKENKFKRFLKKLFTIFA